MKQILFILLLTSYLPLGCTSVKNSTTKTIEQGISGFVTEVTGNRMPSPDAPSALPKGIQTTVFIYESTLLSQVTRIGTSPEYTVINTKQVASVQTDSTGHFAVALPVGEYSLFVQQGKAFYANLFDENNRIAPFSVKKGEVTLASLQVSKGANF